MVYLAGPMRGRTDGFPEFYQAAEYLRLAGFKVFNPPEKEEEVRLRSLPVGATIPLDFLRVAFALDTQWICKHADIVVLLPGWEKSKGATAEKALAEAIGLDVRFIDPETGVLTDAL